MSRTLDVNLLLVASDAASSRSRRIWTNDRDFRRCDGIRVHDPFG